MLPVSLLDTLFVHTSFVCDSGSIKKITKLIFVAKNKLEDAYTHTHTLPTWFSYGTYFFQNMFSFVFLHSNHFALLQISSYIIFLRPFSPYLPFPLLLSLSLSLASTDFIRNQKKHTILQILICSDVQVWTISEKLLVFNLDRNSNECRLLSKRKWK